jgi:ABC-type uncharacterized transport system fused permease/ATPase subunit
VLLQLLVQYRLNFWNRDFFNAIERKDGADIWAQALRFAPLGAASLILAIVSVWGRMTTPAARAKRQKKLADYIRRFPPAAQVEAVETDAIVCTDARSGGYVP